jgi:membrane protease YdiL (CAAX protease family)
MPMVAAGRESGVLQIAGTFGPTTAALLLTFVWDGQIGLQALWKRLLIWRVNILWYLFSFLSSALIVLAAIQIHVWLGGDVPEFNDPGQWYLIIPVFLYVLFLSVLGEEIGWRGYALPRLQESRSALIASLIIGVMWGFWHLPLFWIEGNFHQEIPLSLFVLQDVALSIVLTWLYNGTGGSLLIVHLFHAASNTTLGLLPILPTDTGGELRPLWIAVGLLWIVATVIVAVNGPATLSGNRAAS